MTNHNSLIDRTYAITMMLAPLLLLTSTLASFSQDDAFAENVPQGVIQLFAFGMFFLAFAGLARMIAPVLPRIARLLLVTGAIGAQAGVAFGVVIIARAKGLELQNGGALELAFNAPGILFPLTTLVLGICLLRTRVAPAWSGAGLVLAGIAFPISRIGFVGEVAVVADVLFLISLAGVAAALLRRETAPVRQPALV